MSVGFRISQSAIEESCTELSGVLNLLDAMEQPVFHLFSFSSETSYLFFRSLGIYFIFFKDFAHASSTSST